MNELEILARKHIKGPVKHDGMGAYIFDDKNSMICEVRGRGELQKLPNGIDIQESIGEFIQNAINNYLEKVK